MSYLLWSLIRKDKNTQLLGACFFSAFSTMMLGFLIFILLLEDYYGFDIPFWVGFLYVIVVFPIITYTFIRVIRRVVNK